MKSQKGVTMLALVIYVASFMLITGIVGAITTYFYNNIKLIDTNIATNSEYNKLNLYMAKFTKNEDMEIVSYGELNNSTYITFRGPSPTGTVMSYTFVKPYISDILYLNKAKLCTNVDNFGVNVDESTGKKVLKIFFQVAGTVYSTEYVVK